MPDLSELDDRTDSCSPFHAEMKSCTTFGSSVLKKTSVLFSSADSVNPKGARSQRSYEFYKACDLVHEIVRIVRGDPLQTQPSRIEASLS